MWWSRWEIRVKICIGNLSPKVTARDLCTLFNASGGSNRLRWSGMITLGTHTGLVLR